MNKTHTILVVLISLLMVSCMDQKPAAKEIPSLKKDGNATQLIVDGKPFLVLGGELHNSSSSSREYMKKFWPDLKLSGMNTVLAAVEWSLIEPVEGKFDFTVVDNMLEDAQAHNLRLILLWFGSWKNAQLHYIPEWMKKDYKKYPRVIAESGKSLEILSPFSDENLNADRKAFTALMNHLKKSDSINRTVIMVQVENEVGVLGSPRDHSEYADKAFKNNVPGELTDWLSKHKENLLPELHELWAKNDYKMSGTWEEVFGTGDKTDELFMAWNYAKYINAITLAGKTEYPLPMFVNAWLVQQNDKRPGDYPSGGPQAHMLDIWRAGAPAVDLYCPDIYRPVFSELCSLYTRNNNPLFIPESRAGEEGAGQFFYSVGRHNSIGYSPFGYESRTRDVENDPMTRAYRIASGMASIILEAQRKGTMTAVLLKSTLNPAEDVILGDYKLSVELAGGSRTQDSPEVGYGIFISLAKDEFMFYGKNIHISFSPVSAGPAIAGIAWADEGEFINGTWVAGRRLNGDEISGDYHLGKMALENKTGTLIKFDDRNLKIQWVRLYRYE